MRPLNPPPTHTRRERHEISPLRRETSRREIPLPTAPSPPFPDPHRSHPRPPAPRRVRYTTIPTRTTHLQAHCFDNKGAYTADELLAEDATIRKSTAGATRRRMILHDRLARTIDGWRYELDEERAKPGRRAAPGATAVDELVQPRGYTARGEVVANSGGHHLRNQRTRHLNDQPRGRPPNRLGVVVDVDFTVRPVLSPASGKGEGDGTDIGRESIQRAKLGINQTQTKSKTRGDERRTGARGGARGEATGLRRRVHAVAHQGPERGRGGQRDGAAAHPRPAAVAPRSTGGLLRREPSPGRARLRCDRARSRRSAGDGARGDGQAGDGVRSKLRRRRRRGGFDERVRLAAAGATAHSRILLETGKLRPSSAPASRDGRASKMPLRVLPAAERVARAHGHLSAAKECATRKTSTRAQSARKQAFGYSFASSTNAAAGDRTASVIAPFAPRTATLAEKMCGARMNATATRLNAGRGTTTKSSKNHSAHPPRGFWRTDVTRAEDPGFNVSARPMSPTVERAARPAPARVTVRGAGRPRPAHVFGADASGARAHARRGGARRLRGARRRGHRERPARRR